MCTIIIAASTVDDPGDNLSSINKDPIRANRSPKSLVDNFDFELGTLCKSRDYNWI